MAPGEPDRTHERPATTVDGVVRKALFVTLVVLLVIIGVPVLMPGMGGAHCADCGPATMAGPMCIAVLVAAAFAALVAIGRRARLEPMRRRGRLVDSLLYRPPRLAFVR